MTTHGNLTHNSVTQPSDSVANGICTTIKNRMPLILASASVGGLGFVWVQVLTGSTNIAEFIGSKIVETGGYSPALASPIGWSIHMAIAVQYAIGFAVLMALLPFRGASAARVFVGVSAAIAVGFVGTWVANPAISITISLFGGAGIPETLFPVNWSFGVPLYNHLGFFLLTVAITDWLPMCFGRSDRQLSSSFSGTDMAAQVEPLTA